MSSFRCLSKMTFSAAAIMLACAHPLPALCAGMDLPRELWLAIRSDGRPGVGTQADPFDAGSVEKLNALLAKFHSEYRDGLTLHFGPGTFYGDRTWQAGNNWKVRGAGMDVTVFKTRPNPNRIETVGFSGTAVGFEISDATFDFNVLELRKANRAFAYPKGKENGVEKHRECHFYAEHLPAWQAAASYRRRDAVTHKGAEFMCVTAAERTTEEPGSGSQWSALRSVHPQDLPAWEQGSTHKAGEAVATAGGTAYICLAASTAANPAANRQDWQALDAGRPDPMIYTQAVWVHAPVVDGVKGASGHNRASRVRAVNCHGSAFFDREDFVIGLGGSDNVIEDCTVERFHGDYGTLIALCDGRHSVVRGCTVKANGKCFAYGGWACFDAVFENNYGDNLDAATNIDSLYNRNVTFRGNTFVNCQRVGILVNVGGGHYTFGPHWMTIDGKRFDLNQNGMDGLYIYNNFVEIRDDAPFGAIQAQQKGLTNVVIRGNLLRTQSGHGRARAIGVLEAAHAAVFDNVCEPGMTADAYPTVSAWHNNLDLLGNPMKDSKGEPVGHKPAVK
jgi:hypothetical protein